MGLLDNWFFNFSRPFRELKSKWHGIQNIRDGLQADVGRLKGHAADAKKKAKEAKDKAKGLQDQAKDAQGKAQGAWGQAQGQVQAVGGMMGGKPGAAGPPPGGAAQGGHPGMGGVAQGGHPGMPGAQGQPGMPGMPGMPGAAGLPGLPGAPGMPMGYGGAPGGYGMPMGGPPAPGNRTMAIMAGGSAGYALGWFVPLKGPQRGELITLKPQSVIGKDPTCEVCINDPFLSGRHATVRAQNGVFVLEDHSTNGTWVNDKKVSRHELVDSDFVKVGQTLMKFKAL